MHHSNSKSVRVCCFCGGAQYELARCSGCGAAPVIPTSTPVTQTNARSAKNNHTRRSYYTRTGVFPKAVYSTAVLLALAVFAQLNLTMSEPRPANKQASAVGMATNTSDWYQPNVTFKPYQHTETEIRELLATAPPLSHQLHYVGVHKSSDPSGTVRLNLKRTSQAIVLVLSSYQPVSWVINNKYNNELPAIVYGSYHQGSSVSGDIANDTSLLAATTRIGELTVDRSCVCIAEGLFQCTGNNLINSIDPVQNLSAATLVGISNEESASVLDVPQRHIDTDFWHQQKQLQKEITLRESACIS